MNERLRPPADAGQEEPGDEVETRRPSGDDMIDLPLGGKERPGARVHGGGEGNQRKRTRAEAVGDRRPEPPAPAATDLGSGHERATSPASDRTVPPPTRPAAASRRRWMLIALLVLVAAVVGYFAPRPGAPVIALSATMLDFGAPDIGDGSPPQPVTLTNTGQRDLLLEGLRIDGEGSADYILQLENCTGRPLASGETCDVEVSFRPSAPGTRQAELRIEGNASNSPLKLPLTGAGAAPEVGLDRDRIVFAPQAVGSRSEPSVVTVTNSGSATLEIGKVAIDGGAAEEYSVTGDGCSNKSLEPGGGCSLQVSFAPRGVGDRAASARLPSNAAGGLSVVLLRGTGEAGALAVELPEGELAFGDQVVGVVTAARSVSLRNAGPDPLAVGRLDLRDAVGFALVEDGCSKKTLEAEEACSVGVIFEPTEAGAAETVLRVPFGDLGGTSEARLSGVGIAPRLTLRPAAIDFGGVAVGEETSDRSVTIVNSSDSPVALSGVEAVGTGASSFSAEHDGCASAPLEAGRECEVRVSFRAAARGRLDARLVVGTEGEGAAAGVALNGVGIAASLELSSTRLDFGDVDWASTSRQRLTLRNGGNAALTLSKIEVIGDSQGQFKIERTTCSSGGTLAPGKACGLTLIVVPSAAGSHSARLKIGLRGAGGSEVDLRARIKPPPVPEVRVSPVVIDAGGSRVGERSGIQTVTVQSVGSGPLVVGEVRLEGDHASDFYLVPGSCKAVPRVLPGGSCTVGIRFVPRAEGERQARLIVPHNGESGRSTVTLVGRGGGS